MVRGKTRSIDRPNLNYDIQTKIHNRFDVEVIDTRTGKVRQSCRGHNVICDQLWTNWFTQVTWNTYIFYGSGEGTPTSSDTKLFNRIGYMQSEHHSVDYNVDENWVAYTRKIQIPESTAVGEKITEVGIGYGSTETNLCTHAMLQDMNGNTISIEKTDTDIINIYATVYVHWTSTPAVKIFGHWHGAPPEAGLGLFAGRNTPKAYPNGTFYDGKNFAAITKGILSQSTKTTYVSTYTPCTTTIDTESRKFNVKFDRLTVAQHNTSGLHHLVLYYETATKSSSYNAYYLKQPWMSIEFPSDQVPAVRVTGEAVATGDGVTREFVTKFPHAKNATVYVDGVVATGVTVNPNTFAPTFKIGDYFEEVWAPGVGGNAGWGNISYDGFVSNEIYGSGFSPKAGEFYIFYNPNYEIGIASMYLDYSDIYVSNDLKNWKEALLWANEQKQYVDIPEEFIHYKYWKVVPQSNSAYNNFYPSNTKPPADYNSNNIIFDVAPAAGSVITIDYTPQCIPKDENHVFDLSVTFSFGEYSDT